MKKRLCLFTAAPTRYAALRNGGSAAGCAVAGPCCFLRLNTAGSRIRAVSIEQPTPTRQDEPQARQTAFATRSSACRSRSSS